MKNNKKKRKILIISAIILVLLIAAVCIFYRLNDSSRLTLEETKWIENNKYNVIDVAVMNDIPIVSYEGSGIVYDYLEYVQDQTSLKFNVITYKTDGTVDYNYSMNIVDSINDKDIVLLKDNLVLVTKDGIEYSDINDINNIKIGILNSDSEKIKAIFAGKTIEFSGYDTYADLKNSIIGNPSEDGTVPATVDGIIIPKTIFTKEMIEKNYKVSYHFDNIVKYYVLEMKGAKELNSVLSKNFNEWNNNKYIESYDSNLLNNYYTFKNISDIDQKTLQSKSYNFGFIEYGIYNYLDKNEISGLSGIVLKDFTKFSDLSITYTKYNSISKLVKDFNSNKVDFLLDIVNDKKYTNDTYKTTGVFDKKLVVITNSQNTISIDGIYSLKNKEVLTVKNSYIEKYLLDNGIKVKSYNNVSDMLKDYKVNSIAIIDMENYNYYKTTYLKNSKIDYYLNIGGKYNYIINDTNQNKQFEELFNFYINYNSINKLIDNNYEEVSYKTVNITYLLIIIIAILSIYVIVDFTSHFKVMLGKAKKEKKVHLSKDEKIKYIDQLTSLKNRAYLNNRIEEWDNTLVYPKAIIIIDLNNVAYINDNYGREEGDKVITEAANILMQNQLQNSEIIRTDGNEFLIYLVNYDEKDIVNYLRKLTKEFKNLSHGFGAASGYSIISDEIKTIDDAVNEATLEMKNNKEDIDY